MFYVRYDGTYYKIHIEVCISELSGKNQFTGSVPSKKYNFYSVRMDRRHYYYNIDFMLLDSRINVLTIQF